MVAGNHSTRLQNYLDFELRISCVERPHQYLLEVLDSPAGGGKDYSTLKVPLDNLKRYLEDIRLPFTEKSQLVEIGQALYDFLFVPVVAELWNTSLGIAYAKGQGLNFRLRIESPELDQLPWEVLYDRAKDRFIAPSLQTPLLRFVQLSEPISPLDIKLPLRVLLAISNPSDYPELNTQKEIKWIYEALSPIIDQNFVSINTLFPTSSRALQSHLRKGYHILHYIGHGYTDRHKRTNNLVLTKESSGESSLQDAETIGYLLRSSGVQLAFLNACQTATTHRSNDFFGVAQSLVSIGLPAVIAMQFDIPDTSAAIFAHEMYASLVDGFPIQAAVTEGRKAMLAATGMDSKDWANPILFMRSPTGILFNQIAESENVVSKSSIPVSQQHGDKDPKRLLSILINRFRLSDIKVICFYLDVGYDNLGGNTKPEKSLELVRFLKMRGRLGELVNYIREIRKDIDL